jgi:hypothetical protein
MELQEQDGIFFFLSPEVRRFLSDNDIETQQFLNQSGHQIPIRLAQNPAPDTAGEKEPAIILLASAAVIAAATPILREFIRTISGRDPVIRERRLVPIEDSAGNVVRDPNGEPLVHWVDEVKGVHTEQPTQAVKIKGLGIEISFGGK